MGRLHIPSVNQVSGPWLMSYENLETLDSLFKYIDEKLGLALAKNIENSARQQMEDDLQNIDFSKRIARIQRRFPSNSKNAKVTFKDGSTFEGHDIKEIINHVNANPSLSPTELYIRTIHGNHENEFNLIINSNPDKDDIDFEYRIKCLDYDVQLEIKTAIDKWIRENRPSEVLKWVSSIVFLIRFIAPFLIFFSYSEINTQYTKADTYKQELKKEAQLMIENQEYDKDQAMLLLLKIQSDYIPKNLKSEVIKDDKKGSKKILILSLLVLAISLIRPRTIIGIGNKYQRFRIYKFWWYVICSAFAIIIAGIIDKIFFNFINW